MLEGGFAGFGHLQPGMSGVEQMIAWGIFEPGGFDVADPAGGREFGVHQAASEPQFGLEPDKFLLGGLDGVLVLHPGMNEPPSAVGKNAGGYGGQNIHRRLNAFQEHLILSARALVCPDARRLAIVHAS